MSELGYIHRGDLGVKGRQAFKRANEQVPFTKPPRSWMHHHLYVCRAGVLSLRNHLLLRNYLRNHLQVAQAYGALKQQLALQFEYDIDSYIRGKTDFILSILDKIGLTETEIAEIRKVNEG